MTEYPTLISKVRSALKEPLPGKVAQFEMAAIGRPSNDAKVRDDVRTASVLISLFERNDEWVTAVMKRRIIDGDRHSGQISLPGGKRENGEPLEMTAIRESHEEIGTPYDNVEILGRLTELHVPVSNFIIHPYVSFIDAPFDYVKQESEVESIHEIRIDDLMDPNRRKTTEIRVPEGFTLKNVPYFDLSGEVIWGATAMIFSEFVSLLNPVYANLRAV